MSTIRKEQPYPEADSAPPTPNNLEVIMIGSSVRKLQDGDGESWATSQISRAHIQLNFALHT